MSLKQMDWIEESIRAECSPSKEEREKDLLGDPEKFLADPDKLV